MLNASLMVLGLWPTNISYK